MRIYQLFNEAWCGQITENVHELYLIGLDLWWKMRNVDADLLQLWFFNQNLSILTLYVLNFSERTKHIFTFYVIAPHGHDTGHWNPSSKTVTCLFYTFNIMVADVLATQGARASATMILSMLNRINFVPERQGLIKIYQFWLHFYCKSNFMESYCW